MLLRSNKTWYGCDEIKLIYNAMEEAYVEYFSEG